MNENKIKILRLNILKNWINIKLLTERIDKLTIFY